MVRHAAAGRARWQVWLEALRPEQWVKNLAISVLPWLLGDWTSWKVILHLSWGMAAFVLLSGGVYVVNDLLDVDRDRLHPDKRRRPLARGDLGRWESLLLAGAVWSAGLALLFFLGIRAGMVGVTYVTIMVAYSLGLKHVAAVEAGVVVVGVLLRVYEGGLLVPTPVVPGWYLDAALFSLWLVLAKRYQEKVHLPEAENHRPVLAVYSLDGLRWGRTAALTAAIMGYAVMAVVTGPRLWLSIPWILAGGLWYQRLSAGPKSMRLERALWRDPWTALCFAGWLVSVWFASR